MPCARPGMTEQGPWIAGRDQADHRHSRYAGAPLRLRFLEAGPLCLRGLLCVLIVLPLSWLVIYSVTDAKGAPTLANFVSPVHASRRFLEPLITTFIIATHLGHHLLRGGGADGLAGGAHRPAVRRHDPRAGDGLVRDAALSRRHRLGTAGGAQQRPAQQDLSACVTGAEQDVHLFNIYSLDRPDLRDLLLHVSLRVRAGRQFARPHAGRTGGRLLDPRRRTLVHGAARHDSAGAAGAARRRAGRVPAGDDAVRLAGDPGAAGRLPHHDDQDLEPVPVSAQARARRRRLAAAADPHHRCCCAPST